MRFLLSLPLMLLPSFVLAQEPKFSPDDEDAPLKLGKVNLTLDPGRHTAPIKKAHFSADGKQIFTLSADSSIRIWDIESGETVRVLHPPGRLIARLAKFSADGKRLAIASNYMENDKIIHLVTILAIPEWRVERVIRENPAGFNTMALSADGTRLAVASVNPVKNGVRLWDLTREAPPEPILKGKAVFSLDFSPDGERLAWTNKGNGEILDLKSGNPVGKIWGGNVIWSPDGKLLATSLSGKVSIHNDKGEVLRTVEGSGILDLTFGPDSKKLLINWHPASYHSLATLVDVDTGKDLHKFYRGDALLAFDGACSRDGQFVATVGGANVNYIYIWRTGDGSLYKAIKSSSWIDGGAAYVVPAWTKDGKAVTWYAPHAIKSKSPRLKFGAFDLTELKLIETPQADQRHPKVQEEGGLTLKYVNYNTTQVLENGKAISVLRGGVFDAAFIGQGRVASSVQGAPRIKVMDARTGKEIRQLKGRVGLHGGAPIASPDHRYVMSVALNSQTVTIWNVEQEKPLLTLYRKKDDWVLWTEEGYYAASPGGERLVGWTVDNGIDQMASFYPAEQFSKLLYRPDVLKLVLEKGSVAEALKAANAALVKTGKVAPPAVASPEEVLPAGVTITVDQSKLPEVTVKVSARAAVKGQPIQTLRLMVDGRRLPDGKGVFEFEEGKEKSEFDGVWRVSLPPGRHQIAALALSKDYTPSVSNRVEVACPVAAGDRPALHHLSVGVSTYATVRPNLDYAHKDALQLAEALTDAAKGGLAYRPGHQSKLLEKKATRQNILDQLKSIRKAAQPNDLFVFSFAGHGVRDAGEFFLLPHEADQANAKALNATAISGKVLREELASFPCQVLLMLDACHAGAVGGLASGSDEAARSLSDVEVRVAVLGAAHGHERAKEKDGNGLFTAAVIRALRKDPEAFFNRSTGEMTVAHLWTFVHQEVTREADGTQTPYLRLPLGHPAFTITQFPVK